MNLVANKSIKFLLLPKSASNNCVAKYGLKHEKAYLDFGQHL